MDKKLVQCDCGAKNSVDLSQSGGMIGSFASNGAWRAFCVNCKKETPYCDTKREVIEEWDSVNSEKRREFVQKKKAKNKSEEEQGKKEVEKKKIKNRERKIEEAVKSLISAIEQAIPASNGGK